MDRRRVFAWGILTGWLVRGLVDRLYWYIDDLVDALVEHARHSEPLEVCEPADADDREVWTGGTD